MIEQLYPGMASLQNLHPLFVHFPIAFFLGAALMEIVATFYHERFHFVATWLLYLGVFSAGVTLVSGFGAASSIASQYTLEHDAPGHDLIHVHRNWMLFASSMGACLAIYFLWVNQNQKWLHHRWGLLLGALLLSFLVSMGADRGGRLVFEFGTGVNPEILRPIEADGAEAHGP
ncbi:MAG: DUF2231 domain-containing protein [Nitrospiria bacterium]